MALAASDDAAGDDDAGGMLSVLLTVGFG